MSEPVSVLARRGEPFAHSAYAAPCYRIPAVAVLPSGRVVVCFDVRADHLDLPGEFDVAVTHSDDGGRTWTPPRALRQHEPGKGFGDPSLTFDPVTGRLWCWYVASGGNSFWDDGGYEFQTSYSDDGGISWTHRIPHLTNPMAAPMFASSGNGIALSSGRLLQPMVFRPIGTTDRHAVMARSDDHGETWTLGRPILDCDENKVVELVDGRVLLHARANPLRKQAFSADGGITFDEPQPHPDLPDPSCNGGLTRAGDVLVCTGLDPHPAPIDPNLDPTRGQGGGLAWGQRANLVLRTSTDQGSSWQLRTVVDPGAAAYSLVAPTSQGALVVYEQGAYEAILAKLVPIAE